MVFKSFRINFIIRTILLCGSVFLFFYLFFATNLTLTLILVASLIVFQIISLFRYIDQTNRLLNNFLESIRYSDFTRTFQTEGTDSAFDKLKLSFNEVIKDFQAVRAEKEEHYHYLQSVVQHIGIALIAYGKDGHVELTNNAAKRLFQIRALNNIQNLKEVSPDLVQSLLTIKNGENTLIRIHDKDDTLQLAIYATEFTIHNQIITLVSIKNIQQELEEKELESWQKLIQVLTHEIMNSIAPISSLSSTVSVILKDLCQNLEKKGICQEETDSLEEIDQALKTIHNRTDGLIHFVNTYRSLTKIPKPNFSIFKVSGMFQNILLLMDEELKTNQVSVEISTHPASIELSADEKLIEQVIINLIKNAIQAMQGHPKPTLILKGFLNNRGRISIQVIDNGQGILPNVLDKVFIPFFTTKPQGSGIGLSLSRQIMRMHGGTIHVVSEPDIETRFTLTF